MSQKQRQQILIKKFIQDNCTSEEIAELKEIIKSDNNFSLPHVQEIIELNKSKMKLPNEELEDIYQKIIEKGESRQNSVFKYSWIYYAAAVCVIVLLSTVFVQNIATNNETETGHEQFITLQTSNKSKVLNDKDTLDISNRKGEIIAKQTGNKIVYFPNAKITNSALTTLKVPYGKKFELELSDGSHIFLNSGSEISYPEKFPAEGERIINLKGEAFFEVAHNKESPFIVKVEGLDVEVLGTTFNVAAYAEDSSTDVVLVKGSVGMSKKGQELHGDAILKPGYKGVFNKENGNIYKEEVETEIYTAWRVGNIVFRNMTFNNILKKLERQFGYEIVNQNKNLGSETFNANFGKQPLEEILESFQKIYGINYSIKQDKIVIN